MSEKTFVHVNLLLALGLGNLVYVVDKTAFTNRLEFPVSAQLKEHLFINIPDCSGLNFKSDLGRSRSNI